MVDEETPGEQMPTQAGTVDPGSIPPSDSNEQLGIAHGKRESAFRATAGETRRAAAEKADDAEGKDEEAGGKSTEAARSTPPQGRTQRPKQQG